MSERAGKWLRVSSGKQDEANQAPAINSHCDRNGYETSERHTYLVHGKSAYKGAQDPDWQRVVADVAAGLITVVVLWMVDRLDRRNILSAIPMVNAVIAAGGRIEFADQPYIDLSTMPGRMAFANMCEMAHEESLTKSKRVRAAHDRSRVNGAVTGKAPWGMTTAGDKYNRTFTPTADGRMFIPGMFARCVAGASLATIAAWLQESGARPAAGAATWSPKSIGQLLRNEAFMGRPADGGTCEALVTAEVFTAAGAALTSRLHKRADARAPKRPAAMLTGWLHCALCLGPMYRIKTWDGESYRCSADPAFGAARRSECSHSIPVTVADAMARAILSASTAPVMRQVWRDGDDTAARLAELDADESRLMARKVAKEIGSAGFLEALGKIETIREELSARPSVPGGMIDVPTGRTFGQVAAEAATDGELRQMLKDAGGVFFSFRDQSCLTFADRGALIPGSGPVVFPGRAADDIMPGGYLLDSHDGTTFRAA